MNKNEKEQNKIAKELEKITTHVKLIFNITTSYSLASKITCSFNKKSSDHDITTVYSPQPGVCNVILTKIVEMPDRSKEISKCNDIIYNQVTAEEGKADITRTEYIPFFDDSQSWLWKEMLKVSYEIPKDKTHPSPIDYKRMIHFLKYHNIIDGYFFFKFGEDKLPQSASFLDLRTDSTYMFVESDRGNFRLVNSSNEFISIVIQNMKTLKKLEGFLVSNKDNWAKHLYIHIQGNTTTIEINQDRQGTGLLRIVLTKLQGFFEEFGGVDPVKLKAFLDNPIEIIKNAVTPSDVNLITIDDNLSIGIKVYTVLC